VVILAQLQKVGVQCIVDLFELHPFVREHFKEILVHYGKVDPDNDNALQNILENHAKLLMNIVHEFVVNIDNLDSLTPKLQKLGLFHVKNAVPKRYLDIMGPIFCNAVRPILLKNDVWSSEVEESWMELFKVLTTVMGKSYESVENVPTQLSLSPTQKCVIVATWHSIFLKHMDFMGKRLFVDLFKVEPNILKYFDAFRDVGLSNLLQSRSFQNHGVRIMNLVKFAVENLDNPEK
jgi:hemoglobin-like flavoprotein